MWISDADSVERLKSQTSCIDECFGGKKTSAKEKRKLTKYYCKAIMAQDFNVLRCYACNTFQVDQVKKTSKQWSCKICGKKQSIKQIFYTGNGKDCRIHVQTLNFQYRSQSSKHCNGRANFEAAFDTDNEKTKTVNHKMESFADKQLELGNMSSRWEQFVETRAEPEIESDEEKTVNVTTNREDLKGLTKKVKQKKSMENRTRPYSSKTPRHYELLLNAKPNSQSMPTSSPMQDIQNMDNNCKYSTLSPKIKHLHAAEPKGDKGESKWGQFLTPIMDDVTSEFEDEYN